MFLIENLTKNIIDPITKELLQFENYPTNLPALLAGPTLEMLLNQKSDSLTDLKIYRTRMSEIILRILYKQLITVLKLPFIFYLNQLFNKMIDKRLYEVNLT